jgi:small nuclear ribonucleoprotein (snRNP)-like protein
MSYVPTGTRRLLSELNSLVGKRVQVVLTNGSVYEGILLGFDHPEMNIVLGNAKSSRGDSYPRLFIRGSVIAELRALEVSLFDPQEFANYIVRKLGIRPDAVRVYQDAGVVVVFNSIRVTASGVEGAGPMAARISYALKEYLEAKAKGEQPQ